MRTLAASGDARLIRGIVGAVALLLGVYCLRLEIVDTAPLMPEHATALYAAPGQPDPAELAARERYQWPGWIPVVFLAIVVIYAVTVAARRRRRVRGHPRLPSTQDPPLSSSERGQNGDTRSR